MTMINGAGSQFPFIIHESLSKQGINMKQPNISGAFWREIERIRKRPRYLAISLFLLVFSYVFFITLMDEGQPQKLPIAIVDEDGSYFSRRLTHEINTMQGVEVVAVYTNHSEARRAMQRSEIYAFMDIPEGTYNEVLTFRRPHIAFYTNNAYLMAGSLSYRSLLTIANLASGAVQREILRKKGFDENTIMGLIQPIAIEARSIGNPNANYESYLLTTILPGALGLLLLMLTTYVIGIEMKERTSRQWLHSAGNSLAAALIGKLLPYFLIFTLLGILGDIILFGFLHYPMDGSLLIVILSTLLYLAATQAISVLLISALPSLRLALSVSALYGVMSFSLSGFTYPVSQMFTALQGIVNLFPLRHYYQIYITNAMYATGGWQLLRPMLALSLFAILPLFVYKRLHKALIYLNYPQK